MNVLFISKYPHTSAGLEVVYNINTDVADLKKLTDALAEIGWEKDEWDAPPLPNGEHKAHYNKPGTDVFGLWTTDEAIANIAEIVPLLGNLGYCDIPYVKLDWHDLN